MKMRGIAMIVSISVDRLHNILYEKLQMKNLCVRWVPWLPTIAQKHTRETFCSSICRCSSAIRKIFGGDSCRQTKLESTITHPSRNSSRTSRQSLVKVRRKKRGPFYLLRK